MKTVTLRKAAYTAFGALALVAAPLGASVAMPMATASADFSATITFDGALGFGGTTSVEDGLIITVQSSVTDNSNSATGSATASSTASATPTTLSPLVAGDSFTMAFDLDASVVPSGSAVASAAVGSIVTIENVAPDFTFYFLNFTIDYNSSVLVNETTVNAANQSALASAMFSIQELPGAPNPPEFNFSISTEGNSQNESATGPAGAGGQVFPGETVEIFFNASGSVQATSVPAPASLLILASGLLLMRRRSK